MANISGYAQSAATSIKTATATNDELYTIVATNSTGSTSNLSKISNFKVNASTGAFTGSLDGNATSATTVYVTQNQNNAIHYLNFVDNNNTGSNKNIHTDPNLTCNPSNNSITATTFIGALTGNASTATQATNLAGGVGGSIPYQSSANTTALLANGTAGQVLTSSGTTLAPSWTNPVASQITITDNNTNAVYYPVFTSATGTQSLLADTTTGPFSINPSTGTTRLATTLKLTGDTSNGQLGLGFQAGLTSQGVNSVAVGTNAGSDSQITTAVAVGTEAGRFTQGQAAIAIGNLAARGSTGVPTSSQGNSAIAIGNGAGQGSSSLNSGQGANAVAIGLIAGQTSQKTNAVAIGNSAGNATQGEASVAIGVSAGTTTQGNYSIAIGVSAGNGSQGAGSVAIGGNAAQFSQGANAVAVGPSAGIGSSTVGTGQGQNCVAVGNLAGSISQRTSAVAIGSNAGSNNQGSSGVHIGNEAGRYGMAALGDNSIAIGFGAGKGQSNLTGGQGDSALAIGKNAGSLSQGVNAVAIGSNAGAGTQNQSAIAIGNNAGASTQGTSAIAIGNSAGQGTTSGQGENSIAIGNSAGAASQVSGSICLNASGVALNPNQAGFFVNPVRTTTDSVGNIVTYNSNEITSVSVRNALPFFAEETNNLLLKNGRAGGIVTQTYDPVNRNNTNIVIAASSSFVVADFLYAGQVLTQLGVACTSGSIGSGAIIRIGIYSGAGVLLGQTNALDNTTVFNTNTYTFFPISTGAITIATTGYYFLAVGCNSTATTATFVSAGGFLTNVANYPNTAAISNGAISGLRIGSFPNGGTTQLPSSLNTFAVSNSNTLYLIAAI